MYASCPNVDFFLSSDVGTTVFSIVTGTQILLLRLGVLFYLLVFEFFPGLDGIFSFLWW